jgi:hypothetical protein
MTSISNVSLPGSRPIITVLFVESDSRLPRNHFSIANDYERKLTHLRSDQLGERDLYLPNFEPLYQLYLSTFDMILQPFGFDNANEIQRPL